MSDYTVVKTNRRTKESKEVNIPVNEDGEIRLVDCYKDLGYDTSVIIDSKEKFDNLLIELVEGQCYEGLAKLVNAYNKDPIDFRYWCYIIAQDGFDVDIDEDTQYSRHYYIDDFLYEVLDMSEESLDELA